MDPLTLVGLLGPGVMGIAHSAIQNKYNRDALDAQNLYNTPAAQMQRFKEAGLNPALIYGQMSSSNQSQPLQQDAPDLSKFSDAFMKSQMLKSMQLQQANLMSDLDTKVEMRKMTESRRFNEDQKALINRINAFKADEQFQAARKYYESNAYNSFRKNKYTADVLQYNAQYQQGIQKATLDNLLMNMDVKKAQMLNLELDRQIKDNLSEEGAYYRKNRNVMGIDKSAPFYIKALPFIFNSLGKGSSDQDKLFDKYKFK